MDFSANTSAIASFCRELKEAREFRRITLEDLSRITCVSLHYLRAIEDGDWEQVPTAYRRGYLALYASAAGMNREKVLKSYCALMAGGEGTHGAILDDSPSVLERPEAREVTRARIRTEWYTRLARHPIAFRAATLLIALGGFTFLLVTRYRDANNIVPTEFETVIQESAQCMYGTLAVFPDSTSLTDGIWLEWVAIQSGNVMFHCDRNDPKQVSYRAYDTIMTQFGSKFAAEIIPSGSLRLLTGSDDMVMSRVIHGDTLHIEAEIWREVEDSTAISDDFSSGEVD